MRILDPQAAQTDLVFEQECANCGLNLEVEFGDLNSDGAWGSATAVWFECVDCLSVQYVTAVYINKVTFDLLTVASP